MTPIEQHDWFLRSGKVMTALGRIGANFDFPDSFPMPTDRPVIMAGNHRSLLDLVAAMGIFSRFGLSSRIMVNEAYMRKGPGAKFLRSIGCIATSRDRRDEAEAEAVEALRAGHIVSIMPEGKLIKPEDWVDGVGSGRPGISRIARAADALIVPVGMSNTEAVWPRGKLPRVRVPRPVVTLRVGPAFELTSDDDLVNAEAVMDAIRKLLV